MDCNLLLECLLLLESTHFIFHVSYVMENGLGHGCIDRSIMYLRAI